MVFIGMAQQARLFDAAKQHLGPGGEAIIREAARQVLDLPLDQVTYPHLFTLIKTIERDRAEQLGHQQAKALAAGLRSLRADSETGMQARLVAAAGKRMGPAAEAFLTTTCSRYGLALGAVTAEDLPALAQAIRQDSALLLGDDAAQELAASVLDAGAPPPSELALRVLALVREHLGEEGAAQVRELCRSRLEVELEELGIGQLARVIDTEGAACIGAARAAAFVVAAKQSITSPAAELRGRVLELARRYIGPVGEEFVQDVCEQNGLPFRAVDYEHLMWLAEVLRADAAPFAGKNGADELARGVRALLTGR